MQIGFDSTDVMLLHREGLDCLLPDGFEFWYRGSKFRHRIGGHTDGESSPQFTHALAAGLEPYGWTLPAAVVHDGVYHDAIDHWTGQEWKPFFFTKDEGDQMLKDHLDMLAGDDDGRRNLALVIYEAVHLAGQAAYDAGHKKKL